MWPFSKRKKIETIDSGELSFSQVDITVSFCDNENLGIDDWVDTIPLNKDEKNPGKKGLPPIDANSEQIYHIAKSLSKIRDFINLPTDGVYCPICHIANIDLKKLYIPCPKCGRKLLRFDWN